jgi:hypothetical protein
MDTNVQMHYSSGHETQWNQSTTGDSKTSSNRDVESREDVSVRRCHAECFREFGGAMVPSPSEARTEGIETETDTGAPSTIVRFQKEQIETTSHQRSYGRRVRYQLVDAQTHRGPDSEKVWCPLSYGPRLEIDGQRLTMEFSEARKASPSTERKSDRAVENTNLAPYKKKPSDLRPIWRSSTKAGSFLFPMSGKRGPRLERRPFCGTVTSATRFPLFPASPFRHAAIGWDFMCNSIPRTSQVLRSFNTSGICCSTCKDTSFFSGMAGQSIAAKSSQIFFRIRKDSTSIDSLPMRQNSTPTNWFGVRPNALCPTRHRRIYPNLTSLYVDRFGAFEILSHYFDPAFMLQSYLGNNLDVSIT